MNPLHKKYKVLMTFFMALFFLAMSASSALATHFRFGQITWQKTGPTQVQFTVTTAWRTGFFFSSTPALGTAIPGTSTFLFGDGGSRTLRGEVIANLTDLRGEQYFVARDTFTRNYSTAGNFIAQFSSCCRVSTLSNGADDNFLVQTAVDLSGSQTGSSVSSITPQLQWPQGPNTVTLPIADPDSNNTTCSLAALSGATDAGYDFHPSAGGNALSVSSDCVLSWDASFAADKSKWAIQVEIDEGGKKTDLDFIIEVNGQLALNDPPTCTLNGAVNNAVGVGQAFSISATGDDTEDTQLTMSAIGVPAGATVTPAPGTTANDPFNVTFNWTPTVVGSQAVTINFTDSQNAQGSCNFSVNVVNAPPVADAGTDQSVDENTGVTLDGSNSSDPFGRSLTYSWTQVAGPPVSLSGGNTANPTFTAPGVLVDTVATFELTVDNGSLTDTDTVDITIRNTNSPPVADAGPDQTVEATGALTAVTLDGSGSSDPDGDSLTYAWSGGASGTGVGLVINLSLGVHTIKLLVDDGNGGTDTDTVTITVRDTTAPVLTAPANVTACNDPSAASAVVSFPDATATDNSGSATVTQTSGPASGSAFPIGTTVVTWTATDASGNSATASMTVTVNDCEAPVVTTSDITVEATGPTTPVNIAAVTSATDNVGVTSGPTADNNGPFPVGSTTVNWTACDAAGNCGNATQVVTVTDTTPPVITAPADVTACNDPGQASAAVSFPAPTASDNSGTVTVTQTSGLPSGSSFPVGTTALKWLAEDGSGNTATDTMTVTVNDCEAPVVTTSDITVEATGPTTPVNIAAVTTATDNVGVTSGPTADNNGPFPVGSTTVNWTACDAAGNCGTATQVVTVTDTTPPDITNACLTDTLWPPNHKLVSVAGGSASDAVGPVTVNVSVTSNQPLNGTGDGNTDSDWHTVVNPDGSYSVKLRAERAGNIGQRDYTVTITATDGNGNVSTATCSASVPHDQGNNNSPASKKGKK